MAELIRGMMNEDAAGGVILAQGASNEMAGWTNGLPGARVNGLPWEWE